MSIKICILWPEFFVVWFRPQTTVNS